MKLKALSSYDGDRETRFGDCIILYKTDHILIFDCGHKRHAEEVISFLKKHSKIKTVDLVVSHNDSDHTAGMESLMKWLAENGNYTVKLYAHLYLKHADEILDRIDDGRRTRNRLMEALLEEFNNIASVICSAEQFDFTIIEALPGTTTADCTFVGPTISEFVQTAAQAVDSRASDTIGEGNAKETVMNAASIQLKCYFDDGKAILLCGDASPDFLKNLDNYHYIQLPHHGQLADAKAIFDKLRDPYEKVFLISDNTGSSPTSGGSDDLCEWMEDENYSPALNTKKSVVDIPQAVVGNISSSQSQGRFLGDLDCFCI